MFIESWLRQRKQEGKQEIIDKLLTIAKQRPITEQDLRALLDEDLRVKSYLLRYGAHSSHDGGKKGK